MSYQRIDRISEQVRREVDRIIRDRLSDPRIRGTFSVTRAEVTRDLRYAKIYVSILEEADRAPMMAALKKAGRFDLIGTGPDCLAAPETGKAPASRPGGAPRRKTPAKRKPPRRRS